MVFGMFQINAFQGIFRRVPEKSPLDPFKKVFRDFQRSSKAFQDVSRGLNFFTKLSKGVSEEFQVLAGCFRGYESGFHRFQVFFKEILGMFQRGLKA